MLQPTPSNLRAEISRYQLSRADIAKLLGVTGNFLYILLREEKPMKGDMPYKIGRVINELVGEEVFAVPRTVTQKSS